MMRNKDVCDIRYLEVNSEFTLLPSLPLVSHLHIIPLRLKCKRDIIVFISILDCHCAFFSVQKQVEIINNVLLCVCVQEMCEGGRCSADEWLPLQDLLLPIILGGR